MLDTSEKNYTVEDTLGYFKINIQRRRKWFIIIISLFELGIIGLCIIPVMGIIIIASVQNYLGEDFVKLLWIPVIGLGGYLIYKKTVELIETVSDREVIEIDSHSIKIEKSILGIKIRKEYPQEKIKGLTLMMFFRGMGWIQRFMAKDMDVFMIWQRKILKPAIGFGRGISREDATSLLETILTKFPQYKFQNSSNVISGIR